MPIDTRFQKRPTETIPQYNERVQQFYTPTPKRYVLDESGTSYREARDAIQRTVDPPTPDSAQTFLNTFREPQSAAEIAEARRREAQGLIDSINEGYNTEVNRAREVGAERLSQNNAISVLSGLTGSTEALRTRNAVSQRNEKEVQAINEQRQMALAQVYTQISADARTEAREQLLDATRQAEQIVARRRETQTRAIENLKLMASSGSVDFESFKDSPQSQQVYDYALQAVGGSEDALRGLFAVNRPQDQLVGSPVRVGNTYVQAYQNPLTGKVSYDKVPMPVDLPPEYTSFQKLGDNLVAIPDGWDGDTSKLVTIAGTPSAEDLLRRQSLMLDIEKKQAELDEASAPADVDRKLRQFDYLNTIADNALDYAHASGRAGLRRFVEGQFVGSTDYTNLVAQTNTLRTNLLTLLADPDVKKFFGPQMSNADVEFMMAGGTTMNPELQDPEKIKEEIDNAKDMMRRARKALAEGTAHEISTDPASAQIGQIVEIGGIRYRKTGQNEYEEL